MVFPLTVVALSIAVMIGDGCCAFVSISLGAGNRDAARKSIGSAVLLCMMVLVTVNKGTFIYLQALGRAFASTAVSMVREVLFGVGFALLLPLWFGLDGVLYSMPVSDMLTFMICVIVIRCTYHALDSGGAKGPELCEN